MVVADSTLAAIDHYLKLDQGASFRKNLGVNMPQAKDAFSPDNDPFRKHLGASLIGRKCSREVWYGFRWFRKPFFQGRILRLFNRGHLEEPRFLSLLQMIGCKVWANTETGDQFRISGYKGHFGGSLDGVATGIPEVPDFPVLLEFKTHSLKSFTKLKEVKVRQAKPEHYIQMQLYMGGFNLSYALYLAVNKNDDEIYGEIIPFDNTVYTQAQQKIQLIIDSKYPPNRISTQASWYECKFCDFHGICHKGEAPDRNCRTCKFSVPVQNKNWLCTKVNFLINPATASENCPHYEPIKEL